MLIFSGWRGALQYWIGWINAGISIMGGLLVLKNIVDEVSLVQSGFAWLYFSRLICLGKWRMYYILPGTGVVL